MHFGSRGLTGYGFNVLSFMRKAREEKEGSIRVLDVGAGDAIMLNDLKRSMRHTVETHALTLQPVAQRRTDFLHILTAEHMPKAFEGKFDVIVSNRALEYAVLPHLALRNVALALAPGGRAALQWRPGRYRASDALGNRVKSFFTSPQRLKPTPGALELIREAPDNTQTPEEIVEKGIREYKEDAGHSLAWLNEIARIRQTPGYKLYIQSYDASAFGWIPGLITIYRDKQAQTVPDGKSSK